MGPITGPFVISDHNYNPGRGSRYWRREGHKQARPYNLPLPYTLTKRITEAVTRSGWYAGSGFFTFGTDATASHSPRLLYALSLGFDEDPLLSEEVSRCLERARARFISALGNEASLGISLVQSGQAIDMVGNRLGQFAGFLSAISGRRFGDAGRILGISRDPRYQSALSRGGLRDTSNAFASNVLELAFGWLPLLSDVQNAVKVLESPIPLGIVAGRSTRTFQPSYSSLSTGQDVTGTHFYRVRAKIQAHIAISNSNLYLGQRLGLVNPFAIAVDAIPWSFVLNYFVNLDQFFGQFSDTFGLKLTDAFNSVAVKGQCISRWNKKLPLDRLGTHVTVSSAASMKRELGIPSVRLRFRDTLTLNPQRAITSLALVTQALTR